jgi:hypothetical protein
MIRRWGLLAGLLAMLGCTHAQPRAQSEDDGDRDGEVKTIGDITTVGNADRIPVIGVGLVTRLEGTGGGVPPGPDRTALEDYLRKRGVENVKELFGSKTTALVHVTACIPAGAHKGDPVDIFVNAPESGRTTSLRGGVLEECVLYTFDSSLNVSAAAGAPGAGRSDQLLRGHGLVKGEGAVVAGVAAAGDDDSPSPRRGVVWGGGRYVGPDRLFTLLINPDQQYARVAMRIAERVNETFHGPSSGMGTDLLADAKSKTYVSLTVPGPYRLNMARFLRVVRLIPLNESPPAESAYCQKLARQLLDPATTITAALRLEALGGQSIPALKVGLNSDVPLVRFASAEALAYLGSPSCGEELGRQVTEQPFVQAFALTALASLNEAVCRVKLEELLSAAPPETRYGAFRALRARDERDPLVAGEKLGSYWLHQVAKGSAPQVHYATHGRPEVVLFGDGPKLVPPLSLLAGPEFILRAEEGKATCVLSRFTTRKGKQTKECPLEVAAVLRAVAELGGNYADAVELLRQAETCRGLSCALKADALPRAPTVYDLARAGVQLAGGKGDGPAAVPTDIGVTPTLYERPDDAKAGDGSGAE